MPFWDGSFNHPKKGIKGLVVHMSFEKEIGIIDHKY